MATPNAIKIIHGPGSVLIDYTYYPLVINHWKGVPEIKLFDYSFEARDTFGLRGDPPWSMVYIHELADATPPTSTVRKYAADRQSNDPHQANVRLQVIAVVPNPLLRGVMTAIVWMTGKDKMPTEFAGSMSEAITKAIKTFEGWGVTIPGINPAAYKVPSDFVVFKQS